MDNNTTIAIDVIEALKEMGLEPRSYSGRGMSGKQCVGIGLDGRSPFTVGVDLAGELRHRGRRLALDELSLLQVQEDSLGRGKILYFPTLPWFDSKACTCDELTKSWSTEDRGALCGHLRECPRFEDNFKPSPR